jgi:hypothetical protein
MRDTCSLARTQGAVERVKKQGKHYKPEKIVVILGRHLLALVPDFRVMTRQRGEDRRAAVTSIPGSAGPASLGLVSCHA